MGTTTPSVTFNVVEAYDSGDESAELKDDFGKKEMSINIRQIKNGFIVNRSWVEGEGEDRQYKSEEEYHKENPL